MKGVIVPNRGEDWSVVDNLDKPKPGKNQVLVKSLITAINPMDGLMQQTGLLVQKWPIVLGCDASGEVVEVSDNVTRFKVGDGIFGCTRLGFPGYGTFQEYHSMDEELAFKRPKNISVEGAATIGAGLLTAAICLAEGNRLAFPKSSADNVSDQWFIILGGASSVGQYGIQLAKLCGFKVLASCSSSSNMIVQDVGADATFDYKIPEDEQQAEIMSITQGNFSAVFDASAVSADTAYRALRNSSTSDTKTFSTTMTVRDPMETSRKDGIQVYRVHLGEIGHYGEEKGDAINRVVKKCIPQLESYLAAGHIKPNFSEIAGTGFEEIPNGIEAVSKSRSGKKVVVKLQD